MLIEYKKFNSKRRFGIELEVSSVKNQVIRGSSKESVWTDQFGYRHPCISKQYIRDIIAKKSSRHIVVTDGIFGDDCPGWAQTSQNDYWHVKYDSTCGPLGKKKDNGGWEVASFIAQGQRDLLHIGNVADALRKAGVEVNNNCGLHIHAEVKDFAPEQVAVLVARWIKIEPWICQMLPPHRRTNKYCKLLGKHFKYEGVFETPEDYWRYIKPSNLNVHENPQKKLAINLVNYAAAIRGEAGHGGYDTSRKTVELRMPEGTLTSSEIINWTYLYLWFVDFSKNKIMPTDFSQVPTLEEFLRYLGLEKDKGVYLLSDELFELKKWILNRMVQWGNLKHKKEAQKKLKFMEL
ncbi:MAG: amidoligase family protein [Proteobacteria bacterium]|jgi:hypothetical protein|nr:amidoligase family protein [Pseudomonadota bacterium]